jgi:hypothetical protein
MRAAPIRRPSFSIGRQRLVAVERLVLGDASVLDGQHASDRRYEFAARREALPSLTEGPAPRRPNRNPITETSSS